MITPGELNMNQLLKYSESKRSPADGSQMNASLSELEIHLRLELAETIPEVRTCGMGIKKTLSLVTLVVLVYL